jgi:hypothetical protein
VARRGGALLVAIGTVIVAAGFVGFLGIGVAAPASVTPTVEQGNPSCTDLGYAAGLNVDPPATGTFDEGTLTIVVTRVDESFDWESVTSPVEAVIVTGGPNANVYAYDPPSMGDTELLAPINPENQKPYGLSHMDFCFTPGTPTTDEPTTTWPEESTTTEAPSTSTTEPPTTTTEQPTTTTEQPTTTTEQPTTTTAPTTSTTVSPTTVVIESTSTSAAPTTVVAEATTTTAGGVGGTLPFTGGNPQLMLLVGFGLLGLGARLISSTRASRFES